MGDQAAEQARVIRQATASRGSGPLLSRRIAAPFLLLALLVIALGVRLIGGRFAGLAADSFEIAAAAALSVWLFLAVHRRSASPADPHRNIFDSAGPMVIAIGLDGAITHMNPAAERVLGYFADELVGKPRTADILGPEEGPRLIGELQRIIGVEPNPDLTGIERLTALMDTVRRMPPSQVPSFEGHFRRKDGSLLPVALHLSALRDDQGAMKGLVVVALDVSATLRQEQAARESQERYRDLFEHSTEMIATLSTGGQFLYANPAWKRTFGMSHQALMSLISFEELFGVECRAEVAALFRRALGGDMIERAPLRNHTADGRLMEFELSLSQRHKAGNPLAVRCLIRDVTQQRQREHRLALQLVVSQIVGENSSPDIASMRILEAVCLSQGWDVAIKWEVNAEENKLEFSTAWGAPGRHTDALLQQSMARKLAAGEGLPGRVWREGRPVWIQDLASAGSGPRVKAALKHDMTSGWAVPVRVGNKVLAVLEFYSHLRLREDGEALAAMETVAASLGQMLARTREKGRAEELYRQQQILLDAVADGIFGIDRHGMVSFANPAAGRLLSTAASRLVGKPVHELLHGSAADGEKCSEDCPLRRGVTRQAAWGGEDTLYRFDGLPFPAEYFFTPILDQGRFSGSVLSFRDISQRYALDRLKDEFISTVSHELRTPLTSIRGALGLLSSGILGNINEKAANLLRIAVTNSDRLVRLINDILDLERIQSGKEPITFRGMQLSEVIRQAIDGMQPVADAAGVQLIHDTTQAEISGDPDRLLQVLTNLLSNAVKFSPPNTTVSVMMRPGAAGVTLSVIDQGRGIPADKLEAIFGRFQQVDASDSRQKGGSGLGLAICRTIVLQHAGRIWAERNPVRGSTFRVFLPYKPEPVNATAIHGVDGRGTVLLADANRVTRSLIVEQLSRHGYRVIETATIDQTVAAAREGIEAILLDISLDGMNGWEVLPLLRRDDPKRRTPIVLLSMANHNLADLRSEAEGLITRPVQEEALFGELARVLCGPGEKARVLAIEDDRDLAEVITHVFASESVEVQAAHSRQAALDACFSFQPHLIVLDIGLPDGDGFNVVDWLRQHDHFASLPLVIYSGRDLAAEERRQLTLGPTHFLAKANVQPQQLEALVLTLLRNSRRMEEAPPTVSADRSS
ncbi:MAG TPA: PAS domain S-box protein [Terracidiphilus sp.]|nr:PAS domain S-box protein [Terracidiphilus sp.]